MALPKQGVNFNFTQGLDLKTDRNQVPAGKFLALENAVFQNGGGLQKRYGFGSVSTLPVTTQTTLATLNNNLVVTGTDLYAYNADTAQWIDRGTIKPVKLSVLSVATDSKSLTIPDGAVAPNGLLCASFYDGSTYYYQISDSVTGQIIVAKTALPSTATNTKIFVLGAYFIVLFAADIAGTHYVQYIAVPYAAPNSPGSTTTVASTLSALAGAFDALVYDDIMYIMWSGTGTTVKLTYMTAILTLAAATSLAGKSATKISIASDASNGTIFFTFFDGTDTWTTCYDRVLNVIPAMSPPIKVINGDTGVNQLVSAASNGTVSIMYEITNSYSWGGRSDYLKLVTCTNAGAVGTPTIIKRSVGLVSKTFTISGTNYLIVNFCGQFQPTNFVMDFSGNIIAKFAYANAGSYDSLTVLPNVSVVGNVAQLVYSFLANLTAVNTTPGAANPAPFYASSGVNLASLDFGTVQSCSEISSSLHMSGGQLWQYDGVNIVEHGFHLWPSDINISTATGSGSLAADTYYYRICYEWTDATGKLHRSSPSIPIKQITTTASSTNTIKVPTLRLTSKQNARIVLYRWSSSQQTYYQVTPSASLPANDTTVDSVTITDALADSSILGNTILYTTGGVVENIGAPAFDAVALHKSRLFGIDSEDKNLIWFSKQVLSGEPLELSDLLTLYVAPTTGAQGSTGDCTALASMDDKLIIFKRNSIYYVTGTGPDATGANNDFSEPTFITSVAGCTDSRSIVFMPSGLMFQSDKGIWMLGRDLSTKYVGAAVEAYNGTAVNSAQNIPGTNQVRFTLDSGITLMYDYYYDQWGTFSAGAGGVSSTLWQNKHTLLRSDGEIRQEGTAYLDGSSPVLLAFRTAWFKVAGLQGFQRAYWMSLLGEYITPHKLTIGVAYDYNDNAQQITTISPTNYNGTYGADTLYGGSSPYGGNSTLEQWRIFFARQKCQAVQIQFQEAFDSSYGVAAGAGLTLSGINIVFGAKDTKPKFTAAQSK